MRYKMEEIIYIHFLGGTLSHFNTFGLCIPAALTDIWRAERTEKGKKWLKVI